MRIATSTIYAQQAAAIDNQAALYERLGQQLSSGKKLQSPSDDPAQIGQDLQIRATISDQAQQATNAQNAVSQLTTTDGALSSVVNVLQSARQLAIQGATDTLNDQQRGALANQVDELLQQAIAIGNTKYGNTYLFGGSTAMGNPPVQQQGNPISGVQFLGNEQVQGQLIYNNQPFALSTTFQAAFNYKAANGSPDVFQTLITLRDTLTSKAAVDVSSTGINRAGQTIYGPRLGNVGGAGGTGPAPTLLNAAGVFATTPQPDNGAPAQFSIQIDGAPSGGSPSVQTITIPANAPIDDGSANSVIGRINAVSGATGVTAAFDPRTQKISLTGSGSFTVNDVPTPGTGATTAGNLTQVFNLRSQVDFVQNLSTQLGDIDGALNTVLSARSVVGSRIGALSAISGQLQTSVTDNQKTESGIEDVDIASATSAFSQTQTALQAAYATTTRLESKTLFDYLQ
jgi:flagellar hook-associated protein 3 FlgL